MALTIVIANKVYSSWSMRAWLVLEHFGFDFEERVVPLDQPDTQTRIRAISPSGRVPCLLDDAFPVWDSLAIIEYLHELDPARGVWPSRRLARARARSVSAEMHAGFLALRRACPMNLRKRFAFEDWGGEAAAADVKRIEQMIRVSTEEWGGPFLFGAFSGADAMLAPVATRLRGYGWPIAPATEAWVDAIYGLPAFQKWHREAQAEPWIAPSDEVDAEPV